MDVLSADGGGPGTDASRRRITRLHACLAWLMGLMLLIVSPADAELTPARPADSFVESIGVNTHFYYSDTPYVQHFDLVKQRLAELGVRHVRENIAPDYRPDQYQRLRELAGMGIRADLILGEPTNGISTLDEMLSIVKNQLGGTLDAVEGPNEFDTRGVTDWQPKLHEYQQHLYTAVKSDPSLSSLTVVGPSIVRLQHEEELGDISGMLDVGNIHSYPNGEPPESNLSAYLGRAALNAGSRPVFVTETGYHTALNWTGEHRPVSEAAMATYLPRLFLDYFRRGVARTSSYELIDEQPDPARSDRESNFGLLRNDLSEKPAFDALRNLIDILKDPGPAFAPEPLAYTMSGDQTGMHRVLLQKRDGSFYLALWRDAAVWDPNARAPLEPASQPITLSFEQTVKSATRYAPGVSQESVGVALRAGGRRLTVSVGPEVLLLRVTVGRHPSGRIRAWISRRSVPAGGRVSVRGRLPEGASGSSTDVRIQRWSGTWRTVRQVHTSPSGAFEKAIRLSRNRFGKISRLRVVAASARPSRTVEVRIRDARAYQRARVSSAKPLLQVG